MLKKEFLKKLNIFNIRTIAPILILIYITMIVIFTSLNSLFISLPNLKSIFSNLAIIGIPSIGLAVVMISGNFDLSVGSILGFTSVIVAKLFNIETIQIPIFMVVIIGLLVGILIGSINGFLVSAVGINSIITTLGTLAIFRGLSYLFASEPIKIYSNAFLVIGRGYIFKYVPLTLIYMIIIFIIMYIILRLSKFGRNVYAVGCDSQYARLAGLGVKRIQFLSFVISGFTASISGILTASQLAFGRGNFGVGYEFRVLTVCILGGISLVGGRGSLIGVLISILILGSISNGLALIEVPIIWRESIQGFILIFAILFDSIRIRRLKSRVYLN